MIRQFSWLAVGRLAAALIQLATFILFAKWVVPEEFGIAAAVIGIAVIPQSFLDLGISTLVLRARASRNDEDTVRTALRLNDAISLGFAGLAIATMLVLGATVDHIFYALLPLAIWAPAERNADTWLTVATADGDTHINLISMAGRRLLALLSMVGIMSLTANGTLSFACGAAIGGLGAAAYSRVVIGSRVMGTPHVKTGWQKILRDARPFWLHSFATQLRNIDTMLVALVASPVQAGYYAVASRTSGPLRLVPTSLAPVILANVSKYGFEPRIKWLVAVATGVMGSIYVLLAVLAPYFVPRLLGEEYLPSVRPVQVLCAGLVFGAAASLLAAVLQGKGEQKFVAMASLSASVICIAAVFLGAQRYGALGASAGLVLTFAAQSVAYLWRLSRPSLEKTATASG